MPVDAPPDLELLQRAVSGDAPAFGELYDRYLRPIYRYLLYRVGDPHEAEDLTEMVFLKAWEALPGFDRSRSPFGPWLFRIAHNLMVDYHRRRKPLQSLPETLTSASSEQPELAAEVLEQSRELAAAISRLKPDYQEVLILRFVNGLSPKEISQAMGRSDGAVRVLQHRALVALRAILGQNSTGAGA